MNLQLREAGTCLRLEELRQLAMGQLDDSQLILAERHLEQCATCLAQLGEQVVDDPLMSALRDTTGLREKLDALDDWMSEPSTFLHKFLRDDTLGA